jgi:hypothetical protein
MTPAEIEAALQQAFNDCEAEGYSLNAQQKQILFQAMVRLSSSQAQQTATSLVTPDTANPLSDLTPAQRHILLRFIKEQKLQNRSWKAQLLNDWLQGQDSGELQFVRDLYGIQWLEQIQPNHIAQYADQVAMALKVGDRIEVSNSLWEWVQEDGPCSQEWFPCTVVNLTKTPEASALNPSEYNHCTTCTVRFDNGMEYQIQGIYEWNQYNWRWALEA